MKKEGKNVVEWVLLLLGLSFMICFVFMSCKSKTVYVPMETVKTEYVNKQHRDSIFMLDSIFVDRWKSGDTVFLTKEKYKYLYRDKLIRDSVYINDSIKVPYPVIETKEVNRLRNWQIFLMVLGGVCIGYLGFRLVRTFK